MKTISFVLILLSTLGAFANVSFKGIIEKDPSGYHIKIDDNCKRYSLHARNNHTTVTLEKLRSGDFLTATGSIDSIDCSVMLTSIDYVGLKSLLGYWKSEDGIYTIRDYKVIEFFPLPTNEFFSTSYVLVEPIVYQYSVTPSDGKEWVLFLSDRNHTQFATIRISPNNATLKIFDSETGVITKTKHLSRWGTLKK